LAVSVAVPLPLLIRVSHLGRLEAVMVGDEAPVTVTENVNAL